MTYQVGDRIDLTYLNPPAQNERRALERIKASADKLIPGTKISFLKMATGLIVMNVAEPPMVLSIGHS